MGVYVSDSVHLGGSGQEAVPANHARIGYKTIATTDNVTASSEQAGFPATAAVNGLTYDQWRPAALPATWTVDYGTAVDVDYIGIAGHTFARDAVSVTIQHSADAGTWTDIDSVAPGDGAPLLFIFSTIRARYWRVYLAGTDLPSVPVIFVGRLLAMQRAIYAGVTPVTMARRTQRLSNTSETGQSLGMSIIRQGLSTSFSWENLSAAWVRASLEPFIKYARIGYFFIAWRPEKYPYEVAYGRATDDIRPVNMGKRDLMSVSMDFEGLVSE